jgi:GH25 family lysozyme M1 (1,4-beta-N-acetylmuramidase)
VVERVSGIDVSRWQGEIDWAQVAAEGHRFAMIRSTIGDAYLDPRFYSNWDEARTAGLLVTAYHVVTPDKSAQQQIDYFFDVLGARRSDFPLVVDVERDDGVDRQGITACVRACLQEVEERDGRKPIVYTARWFWDRYLQPSDVWRGYHLWVASYTAEPLLPRDWDGWLFWQYTESGEVSGVSSQATDINWFSGTYEDLVAYVGKDDDQAPARPRRLRVRVVIPKLNVRSGPGIDYEDLGDLHDGDCLDILALTGDDVWVEFAPGKWAAFSLDGETYMKLIWQAGEEL